MSAVLWRLVDQCVPTGWLVLVVLFLRWALRRAPKRWRPLLWGIVGARLLLPVPIVSRLSLVPRSSGVVAAALTATSSQTALGGSVAFIPGGEWGGPGAAEMADVPWMELAGWVWLVGALALLGYGAVSWFRLRRRVDASIYLGEAVYLCDAIDTPFLLGILHPRIYLPSSLEEGQRKNVLAHERAHLARRDHWWKPLGFVLLAVYWFDPFLWLAYGLFCRDIELACDEWVVRGMSPDEIRSYSETLLACTMSRRMLGACPLAFGEGDVKERIRSILEDRKPAFWLTAAAAAACVIAGVCFLTDPPRASMEWARKLRVEDVACIELCAMPQTKDRQYKVLDREETAQAVSLINGSQGRWVRSPEPLSGGTQMLTVTLTDGTRHTVCNEGNVYLKIDDDSYRAGYA